MSAARRRLFLLHLVANALLLWLGYEWLGVGESTRMRLVWSALDALAILGLVCWFHGATLVFFRKGGEATISEAFRVALRHLPALVTAAVAVLVLYGLLGVGGGRERPAGVPAGVVADVETAYSGEARSRGAGFPGRLLAFEVDGAAGGACCRWRPGLRLADGAASASLRWRGGWRYWLEVPVLLAAGLLLPFVLLGWVPAVSGFAMEVVSFSVRMLAAYLLFVGAVWTLEWRTASERGG